MTYKCKVSKDILTDVWGKPRYILFVLKITLKGVKIVGNKRKVSGQS